LTNINVCNYLANNFKLNSAKFVNHRATYLAMVRTKMTAKKSSGGSAERVVLPDSGTNANETVGVAEGAYEGMEWEVSDDDELRHNEVRSLQFGDIPM
jgi:hypothetical protein